MKVKLLTTLLLLICISSYSQNEFRIFDWKTESTLNTHLLQQMHELYDRRRVLFENALKSPDSLASYTATIKKKFLQLIGDLPPVSPLNATISQHKITHTNKQNNKIFFEYTIEKVVFESFPGHHVTANLYIPSGKGHHVFKPPYPAVLFFCGHEDAGKATPSYQQTAGLLAAYGNVVLVIDPVSQSERHQLTNAAGRPLTRGGTTEHTLINAGANLVGTSAAAYELWDNKRALDYVMTRKEVDTSRIGCAGNSGGAIQAIYFSALEPRIKVIAVVSYLASRERTFDLSGPADGCAHIPGEGKALLEMSDFLIAAAPRPLLVVAGRFDFIDYTSTLIAYNELEKVYALLGQPGKLRLTTHPDGHGISTAKRIDIATWFRDWFRRDDHSYAIDNYETVPVYAATTLFSTSTGQTKTSFPNEVTVFDRNLALGDSLEESRKKFTQRPAEIVVSDIGNIVDIKPGNKAGNFAYEDAFVKNGISFRKVPVSMHGEVPIAVLQAFPAKSNPKKIIFWFHSSGKHVIADSAQLLSEYLDQGAGVYVADLRGIGETQDATAFNDPKYYNREYRVAMLALHSGPSLIAQRALDIMDLVKNVSHGNQLPAPAVEIHAEGHLGIAALHAVALMRDRRISGLKLYNSLRSFKDILKHPMKKDWYSYVIPGVLKYYDIPDLVNLIGKEKVEFINLQK